MYSKNVSIENTDLTSGEVMVDVSISKEFESSNNSRTEVFYPTTAFCVNNSGKDVSLVFLSSGEVSTYSEDRTNFDGIKLPYDADIPQKVLINTIGKTHFINVIAEGALSNTVEISLFNYTKSLV